MTGSENAGDEVAHLRAKLAECQQENEDLSRRLHEVILERGRLLDEVRVYRTQQQTAALNEGLKRLNILDSEEGDS